MPVNFVAFCDKGNKPIFTHSLEEDAAEILHLEMIANSALDIVEERIEDTKSGHFESFLGELLVVDSHHVFGYFSNTKVKTLIICNSTGDYSPESPRLTGNGQSLRDLLLALYSLFVKDLQNPLQGIENVCTSSTFRSKISNTLKAFSSAR